MARYRALLRKAADRPAEQAGRPRPRAPEGGVV